MLKIAKAYDDATLALAEAREQRKHLGASIIGDKCDRKIWYMFHWAYEGNPFEPRMLRLFNRGHREEPEILRYLRAIPGVQIWAAGESGDTKEELRISDVEGHFGGTPDGVILGAPDFPDEYLLLEFKTMNDSQWHQTKKDGVIKAHWEYFVQMQVYMEKLNLGRALFVAVNKDDDQVHFEYVYANGPEAQKSIGRARTIIYAEEPPARVDASPGYWLCNRCTFKNICHFDDIPAINCRTCVFASPGPEGTWECAKGRTEIGTQQGCPEHIYPPAWFSNVTVQEYDPNMNWIKVHDGVSVDTWGPAKTSSAKLLKHGFVPF